MEDVTNWIVAIATVVIAGFAVTNYILARALKSTNEQYQQKTNDILKALARAVAYNANTESRREAQKELKELEGKAAKQFITKR